MTDEQMREIRERDAIRWETGIHMDNHRQQTIEDRHALLAEVDRLKAKAAKTVPYDIQKAMDGVCAATEMMEKEVDRLKGEMARAEGVMEEISRLGRMGHYEISSKILGDGGLPWDNATDNNNFVHGVRQGYAECAQVINEYLAGETRG